MVIEFKIITIARYEQNIFEIGHSYSYLSDIFNRRLTLHIPVVTACTTSF